MKEEIVEGLKNALSHGASLDNAVRSFLAAGYSPNDVNEAALSLTSGTLSMTSQQRAQPPSSSQAPQAPQFISQPNQEKKETPKWLKVSIIVMLIIIIIMGFVMLFARSGSL